MIALILLCLVLCGAGVWSYCQAVADEVREAREMDRTKAAYRRVAAFRGAAGQQANTCGLCGETTDFLQLVTLYDDASWLCLSCARVFSPSTREVA